MSCRFTHVCINSLSRARGTPGKLSTGSSTSVSNISARVAASSNMQLYVGSVALVLLGISGAYSRTADRTNRIVSIFRMLSGGPAYLPTTSLVQFRKMSMGLYAARYYIHAQCAAKISNINYIQTNANCIYI